MCQPDQSKPPDPSSSFLNSPSRVRLTSCRCVQKAWLASRVIPRHRGSYLMPGAHRQINEANIRLAITITRGCAFDLFIVLWRLHPVRTTLMMFINVVRGLFPAFRGYSQAMIVDEVRPHPTVLFPSHSSQVTKFNLLRLLHLVPSVETTGRRNIPESHGNSHRLFCVSFISRHSRPIFIYIFIL